MTPQKEQRREHLAMMLPEHARLMEENLGFSCWYNNRCVAAAGCVPIHPHRAVLWAVLSPKASECIVALAKHARRSIRALPYRRIEMQVNASFEGGCRFAELIGMKLETPEPLIGFGALGEDQYIYSKVR